jgi:hypothetical protein
MDEIEIGATYEFAYPKAFKAAPDYSAHRGQPVRVIRLCDPVADKVDPGAKPVYVVQADDGWTGHANPAELLEPITSVLFRKRPGKQFAGDGVTAVFPCEPHDMSGDTMSCYVHVGQHGACHMAWYQKTVAAKPDEYADLKHELESAPYGYRLKVYSRMQPWMREARREAVRKMMKAVRS